jgi:uncharacterized protein (UPF0332 family)
VKPETGELLAKARECLVDAIRLQPIAPRVAGREAYLAAFHAAQALIYEHTSRIAKTHRGVRVQFSRLSRNMPDMDPDLRRVLAHGYEIKSRADYGTGPEGIVSVRSAEETIEDATAFLKAVEALLG